MQELKNTVKYPTTLIVNGASKLAIELADSLLEQGGYVILVDTMTEHNKQLVSALQHEQLLTFVDYEAIPRMQDELRRLDYVFYLSHEVDQPLDTEISTQQFLEYSNYLDHVLDLTVKFEAKMLLTTSIDAHRQILQQEDVSVNFGKQQRRKHAVYTEMELQRYAESLTMEYVEKVELNGRIVRIGEIVGEGLDLDVNSSPFVNMIKHAVAGKKLPVISDGLREHWYVHILDAVYGLIKAQFSRKSAGNIYTLSYPDTYSDLSIAYKIHDLEPEAGEIEFVDQEQDQFSEAVKLYKPAPNISTLGWKPKVEMEEAINQSLATAKLHHTGQLAVSKMHEEQESADYPDKLKSFLKLAKDGTRISSDDQRRLRRQVKTINIVNANKQVKSKRYRVKRGPVAKFLSVFFLLFRGLQKQLSFIGSMTPAQFMIWLIAMILFVVSYFTVISPTAVVIRDYVLLTDRSNTIAQQVESKQYVEIESTVSEFGAATASITTVLRDYAPVAQLVGATEQHAILTELFAAYSDYSEGARLIVEVMQPVYQYLNAYEAGVFERYSADSYLSVQDSYDYSDYLTQISAEGAKIEAGQVKLRQAIGHLSEISISALPVDMQVQLSDVNDNISRSSPLAQMGNSISNLSQVLGVGERQNYLVLLQDNSRYTPSGGVPVAFAYLGVQNGSIVEARVQTVDSVDTEISGVTEIQRALVSQHQLENFTADNLLINEGSDMVQGPDFALYLKQTFDQVLGVDIDYIVVTNYSALSEYIASVDGDYAIDGVEFASNNVLGNLKLMSEAAANPESRRQEVSAQLLAKTTYLMLERAGTEFFDYITVLQQYEQQGDLFVYPVGFENNEQLFRNNYLPDSQLYVRPVLIYDDRILQTDSFANINLDIDTTISDGYQVEGFARLRFPSLSNIDVAGICFPTSAVELNVSDFAASRYRQTEALGEKCVMFDIASESEVVVNWSTTELDVGDGSSMEYAIVGQPGVTVATDLQINVADGINVIRSVPELSGTNPYVFTEQVSGVEVITLYFD